MGEELVKRLWECASGECFNCSQYTPTTNASICQKELMKQAADAIEELMRRCEQFQYMPPPAWIPVTERLPLLNTPVLATDGIEVDISWMYGVPPRWVISYTAINEDKLTHWMPLPQTPKGEK